MRDFIMETTVKSRLFLKIFRHDEIIWAIHVISDFSGTSINLIPLNIVEY